MLSPWPSQSPRTENNLRNNSVYRTRTATLQRIVKMQNMSLRGNCPIDNTKKKGKKESFLRRRNPFEKIRKVLSRKIRMPRGNTRIINNDTDPIEADNFDAYEETHASNIIQTIAFKDVTWPWWCRLQKDRSGTALTKESYVLISCRILDHIMGPGEVSLETIQAAAELDWKVEMEDETNDIFYMSQRTFLISMFKIAYIWSPTSDDLDDIVQFLGDLYIKIKKKYGFHSARNDTFSPTSSSVFSHGSSLSNTRNSPTNILNRKNNRSMEEESTVQRWPLKKDGMFHHVFIYPFLTIIYIYINLSLQVC